MNTPAYTTTYANPQRSSRVDVAPHAVYQHVERLVLTGPHRLEGRVTGILADATRVAVRYGERTVVLEPYGSRELWAEDPRWLATLRPDALVLGPQLHPWDGEPMITLPPPGLFQESVQQWIGRLEDDVWCVGVTEDPAFDVQSMRIRVRGVGKREDDLSAPRWNLTWTGAPGAAVIASDGRVLVTALDRRLAVVGPGSVSTSEDPEMITDRRTDVFVHDLSAMDGGFMLLATAEPAADGPPLLIALDDRGNERWRASVPFRVDHPPIDLGDGRTLVAGDGLACFADGKLRWSLPTGARSTATVLDARVIALAHGRELHILHADGKVRETVQLPGASDATSPPAVAPDGTLYVGTQTDAYAIR